MIIQRRSSAFVCFVIDFPFAWHGRLVFTWGVTPAAEMMTVLEMCIVSLFFDVVTQLVHHACTFRILPALIVRVLGFHSMLMTRFKILVISH